MSFETKRKINCKLSGLLINNQSSLTPLMFINIPIYTQFKIPSSFDYLVS